MPRITHVKTNFTAGELDPELLGRTDLERYNNAADKLENVLPAIRGGAGRRPGSLFEAAAKFSDRKGRMMPFVFSTSEAYVLEFGHLYVRFYKNNVRLGAPYELAHPYTEAQLFELDYCQGADTMFVMHQGVPTHRLRRFGDTNWTIDPIPFEVLPFDEIGHSFSATLTLSAATVGVGRTFTASSGVFLNGDVGREIFYQGGSAKITAFTDTSHVTCDITSAFASVNVPADVWTLAGSPQESVTPGAKDPVELATTLTSAALNIWRAADVGKFVRINGGLVQITTFTSTLIVQVKIKQVLSGVVAAPANAWSLEAPVWSAQNGYPGTGTLHQQRLILGSTPAFPQTIWGSSIGTYLDYLLGALDSDAFAYTLSSDHINPIRHMASAKVLFAFGYEEEFSIKGGVEKPITPTNVQVDAECAYGSSDVRPARVGKEVVFVDQAATGVYALRYEASDEDYDADDLTLLASHITAPNNPPATRGLVEITYQKKPTPVLWGVRADGALVSCTLQRKNDVVAWARHSTDGIVESACTIPVPGGFQTWLYVQRTVNGATVRYIERMDESTMVDCGVHATSAGGTDTWAAAHLVGKSVDVVADGAYMGRVPVPLGGNIVLSRVAFDVTIGLPYTSRIKLLTPDPESSFGKATGQSMRTSEVIVRFHESYYCTFNGKVVPFRRFGSNLLDQPLQAVSGLKNGEELGWEKGSSDIEIASDLPFPFTVLAVIRKFTWNDG